MSYVLRKAQMTGFTNDLLNFITLHVQWDPVITALKGLAI